MNLWLLAMLSVAFVLGAAHLWARAAGRAQMALWLKPLPVALALAAVLLTGTLLPPPVSSAYRLLVAMGLLISMAGDIFLALPRDRFVPGLASFLVAHLLYIAAFVARVGLQWAPLALLLALAYGALMLWLLLPRVAGALKMAVALYMAVILIMGWQAAGMWLDVVDRAAAYALAGALFFIASDSVLAWDRFRARLRPAAPVVMTTYYLAQWLLALSVVQWGM